MLSEGMFSLFALSMAALRRGFANGSLPPSLAATMISFTSLPKSFPLLASLLDFLCLMFAHLE